MDRVQQMSIFLAVVDAGGFSAAARRLLASPPVVTRAVAELEGRLGVRLLERTTRSVRVTEAGARYADDCRRILQEIADADDAAAGSHREARGELVVSAPALFGTLHVMPIITRFLRAHPQVQVRALFLDRIVHLIDEGVDVAVRLGRLPDSGLVAVPVGHVRRVLVAAPAYLRRRGRPRAVADLARHVIIQAAAVSPQPVWHLQEPQAAGSRPADIRLQPRLVAHTNDAAIAAALDGFGITRVVSYQVAELVAAGRLVTILDDADPDRIPVHVVHASGRRASARLRAFVDCVVPALRSHPALRAGSRPGGP